MYFSPAFILAALPFLALVDAVPVNQPPTKRGVTTIPISKRAHAMKRANGVANIEWLTLHKTHVTGKINRGASKLKAKGGKGGKGAGSASSSASSAASSAGTAASGSGSGVDALTDQDGQLWFGEIEVGNPPTKFTVDFDTGSSDLFLPGPDCDDTCDGHTTYDPSQSSDATDTNNPFQTQFGDGSTVEGEIFTDTVSIAGLTASQQAVGAASQYSDGFAAQNFQPDGLMGMAFESIAEFQAPPVFQSLINQNAVSQPIFSFKLAETGAQLTLGDVEGSQDDFVFTPVTQEAFWSVNMDSVSVNGQPVLDQTPAIIDTGTTLIVGDSNTVSQIYAAIPGAQAADDLGQGFFTVPCDSVPTVSLSFGGTDFAIDPSFFNLGQAEQGSSDCVGGIMAGDVGDIGYVVGDVFLQNVIAAFDVGNSQVGFTKQ